MKEFSSEEAQLKIDHALEKGEERIQPKDGQIFTVKSKTSGGSPLDVEGIDLGITTSEILNLIKEGRKDYLEKNSAD